EGNVGIGTTTPGARLTVNGSFIRAIARATGLGPNDGTDTGQIVSRVLSFTKTQADTAIRVGYTDNMRVYPAYKGGRWEIRVDGVAPPGGALIYDIYNRTSVNPHHSRTWVGYVEGLGVGTYQIQIWVGPSPGYSGVDNYTGWNNSRWTIEAEEVY
ncbi:MAG: hypothetical protein KJ711_00975, partial [Candidatus Omnitrophica bacterium]|nr:hypothetical protein [Candidatus Omnitrophota bacterium]